MNMSDLKKQASGSQANSAAQLSPTADAQGAAEVSTADSLFELERDREQEEADSLIDALYGTGKDADTALPDSDDDDDLAGLDLDDHRALRQ